GKTYNAGWENSSVGKIAQIVREVVAREVPGREDLEILTTPSDDIRSYRISSKKIYHELGFLPKRTIGDAVHDLVRAFANGEIPNAMTDSCYYNIKTMQQMEYKQAGDSVLV